MAGGTISNAHTRNIRVGNTTLIVDTRTGNVLHLEQGGRIIDLPPNSHFNGNKKTVDLPGGDHLTFSGSTITRNTPKPKHDNKLEKTTYYKNPYTGPGQKVNGLGQTAQPGKPDAGTDLSDRNLAHTGGITPPPMKQVPAPVQGPRIPAKAAPTKTPAKATPVKSTPPTGGRTSVPTSPAPTRTAAPAPARAAAPAAPVAVPTVKPGNVDAMVRQMYGDVAAFLHDPELGPILRKAATEGWDNGRLQGAISQTKWWKNSSDPSRKWQVLNTLDHGEAKRQVDAQSQAVTDIARTEGLTLSPLQVHDLAVNALKFGWTSGQVRENLFKGAGSKGLATSEQTRYGYLAAFADIPEVKALLDQGAREGWNADRLQVALQGTQWWKTTTDAQRKFDALGKQDPQTQKATITQQTQGVLNSAQALGVTLSPDRAAKIAEDSLRFGWSPEQISRSIGAEFHYSPTAGGTAGKSASDLKALAAAYALPMSDQAIGQWTEQIVRGMTDETAFENYLKEQAKTLRPWMAQAIDDGQTVAQYVDPLKQTVAQQLEVSPDSVDLTSPKFSRLLDGVTEKDGTRRSMTLSEVQNYARSLDDWKYTKAANQQTADYIKSLLETFAKVA